MSACWLKAKETVSPSLSAKLRATFGAMAKGKICKTCKCDLPRWAYYKNKLVSDGLSSICKECGKTYGRRKRAAEKEWSRCARFRSTISLAEFCRIKIAIPEAEIVPLPCFCTDVNMHVQKG